MYSRAIYRSLVVFAAILWGASGLPGVARLVAVCDAHPPESPRPLADKGTAAQKAELRRFQSASALLQGLMYFPSEAFPEVDQRQLESASMRLSAAVKSWAQADQSVNRLNVIDHARRECYSIVEGLSSISTLFENSGALERVWLRPGGTPLRRTIERRWMYGGVLMFRVGRQDQSVGATSGFFRLDVDLAKSQTATLDLGGADPAYVAVFAVNAAGDGRRLPIRLLCSGIEVARIDLVLVPPPTGNVRMTFVDGSTGRPTPVAVGLYAADNRLIVPEEAVPFDEAMPPWYQAGRVRPMIYPRYWPGAPRQRKAFFIDGSFSLRVPVGTYTLIAAKGMEYLPVTESVAVKPDATVSRQITLKRWVDMPGRGWYSGDGHVHYQRLDKTANSRLILWSQAEDVHMVNVLRFGDAVENYCPQYAYGKEGRFVSGDYAIVPGQEDPRSQLVGHTLEWNIKEPVRFVNRYYVYDLVFDEVHRQGGLVGYAHVVHRMFNVTHGMTISIPLQSTDFTEICQFGDVGEKIYYEFLNLGFRLTASAGSDVPWGNTIGDARVYVYTGAPFDPDKWYAGLSAGHTFVTTGPMLDLTIDGKVPGSEISARRGDVLHVRASAFGQPVPPRYLEIVSRGEVIKAVQAPIPGGERISLNFTLPVDGSTWIAARCAGGHTTPIYIKVGSQRSWRLEQVKELVAERLKDLREMDEIVSRPIVLPPSRANEESSKTMERCGKAIRERTARARAVYENLLQQAAQEQARQEN